jgi:hypothetical protein
VHVFLLRDIFFLPPSAGCMEFLYTFLLVWIFSVISPEEQLKPHPVKLCIPAPIVERREPIRITHLLGHAISATNSTLPIL